MLKNYLTVALRTLRRRPVFAAINVGGLAVGLAACLLIGLFVRSEWAVNDAIPAAERIYRIDSDWHDEDAGLPFLTLAPVGPTMKRVYPQVAAQTRLYGISVDLRAGEQALRDEGYVADSTTLDVFGLPLLRGHASSVLGGPRSVVIREDLARELFGSAGAAMGEAIYAQTWQKGEVAYAVTGVWKKLPRNSVTQLSPDAPARLFFPQSGAFVPDESWNAWENPVLMQFVKLAPGADAEALRRETAGFIEEYAPEAAHDRLDVKLSPLTSLYLTAERRQRIYLVGAIAALVLLLAGINFANLRTARSLRRAREVGVRRAVGAQRVQLIGQFLGESVLMSLVGALIGALLARLLLAPFLQMVGADLALVGSPFDAATLGALAGFAVLVGLVAGAYPALVLSGYEPARVLGGSGSGSTAGRGRRAGMLRRALIAVQFGIATALLVGVFTVHRQLSYVQGRDLGFEQEHVVVIDTVPRDFSEAGRERIETLKAELRQLPGVQSASLSIYTPGARATGGSGSSVGLRRPAWRDGRTATIQHSSVDDDFLDTYGIRLKRGRMFSDERAADSSAVVINERAAEALGLENPLGKHVESADNPDAPPLRVVGVVENVNWGSLHARKRPLALFPVAGFWRELSVRLAKGRPLSKTVDAVRATWDRVLGGAPFAYTFMDERVEQAYASEQRTQRVAGIGALLAVVIACLGLFGLAAFAAERRRKEIAVRKTFGANARQIVGLLSKDFLRLVGLGLLVATPVAYFAMQRWLEGFAYRIDLGPLVFLAAGALALVVALAATGAQALRAARANPAQALRDE